MLPLPVELAENAIRRDSREIGSISGHACPVIRRRTFEVRRQAIEPAHEKLSPGQLQLGKTSVGSVLQVPIESRESGVAITHFTLYPAPSEEHLRITRRQGLPGATQRLQRHTELDVHPLTQGRVGQVHQASSKRWIDLG